jgi:hypothetical protein
MVFKVIINMKQIDETKLDFENNPMDCLYFFTKYPDLIAKLSKIPPSKIALEVKLRQMSEGK